MKERQDKFTQHVKTAFDNYNDDFAEQGWAALRQKYPEKKNKRLPIWWLSAAAACLTVIVGLYFVNKIDDPKKNDLTIVKKNAINKPETLKPSLNSLPEIAYTKAAKQQLPKNFNNKKEGNNKANLFLNNNSIADTAKTIIANNVATNNSKKEVFGHQKADLTDTIIKKADQTEIAKSDKKTSTEDFLKEQSKLLLASAKKEEKKAGNKTTFDVFTGTFLNYYDNHESKLNAGLGLNANIKLHKSLVLSVGAGISQNKINYKQDVPIELASAMVAHKTTQDEPNTLQGFSTMATNNLSFNGKLLSIDLPVAVKFYPTSSNKFYLSTGINSSTYISQKYTYNYSVSNFAIKNGEPQVMQETEKSSLNGFDFANSAIIAVGISQNFGKNTLIFEPYYKPSLNTMGNKNLRISSAGLNLKFNFNGNKKD